MTASERQCSRTRAGHVAAAHSQRRVVALELNGKALKREEDASPREKLFSAMREVEPGDKAPVRYRRDGKVSTASLVAGAPANRVFMGWPFPGDGHAPGHLPHLAFMRAEGVFGSAELVPLRQTSSGAGRALLPSAPHAAQRLRVRPSR